MKLGLGALELALFGGVFVALAINVACGGATLTPSETALVALETTQQTACVQQHLGDAGAQDSCRADVKAFWNSYWALQFPDGGAQ